jgi:uncharacterized membrane protein YeaQ/YmgE (transglycosylase-associated protein family)
MDPFIIVIWLAIGAVAGWLASLIVLGRGLGLIWDIIVGIVGAAIAGYLGVYVFGGNAYVSAIINSAIGAIILLVIIRLATMLMPKRA